MSECRLTNEELIRKVRMWVDELCRTGGKGWSLQVPVNMERDPDILISELCNRFDGVLAPYNLEPVPVGEQELRDAQPGGSTPSQYALPKGAAELQDLIEFREMNFAMGNIFKACYREKDTIDRLYDIRKILWFAQREEQRLMKEADNG